MVNFFVESLNRYALPLENAQHILQRTGYKEILLLQPQLLTGELFVVGVEDFGDVFGGDFILHGTVVVALVKGVKVKGFNGFRFPQPAGC